MTGIVLLSLFQRRLGTASSSGLHSTCGNLSIASSLIDDGRLMIPSKCSAHLFKTASLSVRRLVPSALKSGVVSELWGPYTVQCIKELLHIISVCKGLEVVFSARSLACL